LIEQFIAELERVGGQAHQVPGPEEACRLLLILVERHGARRVALAHPSRLASLGLEQALATHGVEVIQASPDLDESRRRALQQALAGADLVISGADYALAETGTLVLAASAENPRMATVLPPVHAAVIHASQLIPTFADLVPLLKADLWGDGLPRTSCLTFITGPSRTADIEETLTIGVHGPGELHVIILP
jgi:L-lactate dehydrogenase complex protein LldG